jgi:hypothetical protein
MGVGDDELHARNPRRVSERRFALIPQIHVSRGRLVSEAAESKRVPQAEVLGVLGALVADEGLSKRDFDDLERRLRRLGRCRRCRQTALRLRHRRRQQTKDNHQWGTGGQITPFPRIRRI